MNPIKRFKGSNYVYTVVGTRHNGTEVIGLHLVLLPQNGVLSLAARFVAFHEVDEQTPKMDFTVFHPREVAEMVVGGYPKPAVRLDRFAIRLFKPAPNPYSLPALCDEFGVWLLLSSNIQETLVGDGFELYPFDMPFPDVLKMMVLGEVNDVEFAYEFPNLSEGEAKPIVLNAGIDPALLKSLKKNFGSIAGGVAPDIEIEGQGIIKMDQIPDDPESQK